MILDETDARIMIMRSKGYHENEIAEKLNISQPAVSQRIKKIRRVHGLG